MGVAIDERPKSVAGKVLAEREMAERRVAVLAERERFIASSARERGRKAAALAEAQA